MNKLRPRIIPSLLMEDGRLIKTRQFTDPKYVGDPINAVKIFNEKEVDELALFDIGAWKHQAPSFKLLEKIAVEARMPLCYGGGVTDADQAARLVGFGFEKISISHAAIENPGLVYSIAKRIGRQSVVVTLDVRRNTWRTGWSIYVQNGTKKTDVNLLDFIGIVQDHGAGEILINSIDREGQMQGYDLELAHAVADVTRIPMTFLGGAGSPEHMAELVHEVGTVGAAAGTIFVFKGVHRAVLISYTKPSLN